MIRKLRDEELFSKVEIFHLIFADDIKTGVVVNDEVIIFGVEKILWIRCEPWLEGLNFLVFFGYLESYEICFFNAFHELKDSKSLLFHGK